MLSSAVIQDQVYQNACVDNVKVSRTKLATDLKNLEFTALDSYEDFGLADPLERDAEFPLLSIKITGGLSVLL